MPTFPFLSRFRSSCFAFSGAVVVSLTVAASTQAQTPTFNVAEHAEYNEKTDAAAASFAAEVARRSAVESVPSAAAPTPASRRVQNATTAQNTPNLPNTSVLTPRRPAPASAPSNVRSNRSNAPKSQAARTWEAFLFGTPKRPVSTPKFAFAQRGDAASPVRVDRSRPTNSALSTQTLYSPQTARSAQPAQSTQTTLTAQTSQTTTDAELAAARRRRLQELNAILAARRPEEFSRRLALNNAGFALPEQTPATADAENADFSADDAPALPILVINTDVDRPDLVRRDRAELARNSADASFDVARANRSKIRQASNLEPVASSEPPRPLELADDGFAVFHLPTRPNALRLSPNVFLSTDLVPLPSAAPLREPLESAQTSQDAQPTQSLQNAQTSQDAQPTQPLQNAQTSQDAQPTQPYQNAQTSQDAQPTQTVATPLPPASSSDVPTLRPTAQFVEPRFLPTRR